MQKKESHKIMNDGCLVGILSHKYVCWDSAATSG